MSDVQPLFKLCVSASNMRYVDFIMMMVNEKFPKQKIYYFLTHMKYVIR